VDQLYRYYRYFHEKNIPVDMIPVDADFSKYKVVLAPVLYMVKEGVAEALETYVSGGGVLVTGFMSGIADQSDNVCPGGYPGPLRKLAGIWAEEIDALAPGQTNTLLFSDGTQASCDLLCDIIHLEGAVSLADYGCDFYAFSPAVTQNSYGGGTVFYVGTQPEEAALTKILDRVTGAAGVSSIAAETKLEVVRRSRGDRDYIFLMNLSGGDLPVPEQFVGTTDILSGGELRGDTVFRPFGVAVLCILR